MLRAGVLSFCSSSVTLSIQDEKVVGRCCICLSTAVAAVAVTASVTAATTATALIV